MDSAIEQNEAVDKSSATNKDMVTFEGKRVRRILLIANKRWEADPLMGVLLEKKVHLKSLPWPAPLNISAPPPENTVPDTIPRALIVIEDAQTKERAEVEFWCLEDLMNTAISSSSTKEKVRVLKNIYAWQDKPAPDFVIAFGTAGYPSETSHNGCVVIGGGVFIHDPRRDEADDKYWHDPRTDNPVSATIPANFFAPKKNEFKAIDENLRAQIELCTIPPPINPAEKQTLLAAYNYTSVGVVNITNYDDYAWADHEALEAFERMQHQHKQKHRPVGSIETTHGIIRLQSEAPFLFISGITDRLGYFNLEVTSRSYSQNFACAHNAGVVTALLLPRIARYASMLP